MKQLILILLACLTTSTSIAQLNSGDGVNRQVPVDGKKLTVFTQVQCMPGDTPSTIRMIWPV
ncbi:MAG TPA: hypothetical protein VK541_06215 [Pedobacter sp.]|uniref:hypothetical protein n=1 Tax=Pedobacter sp. TaxID=1411316 RepID=UPI002CB76C11|nr:hypothetical protein [Pedobacter sp.]HMI02057.1 hypothetical protein [Pedobacter sp.]